QGGVAQPQPASGQQRRGQHERQRGPAQPAPAPDEAQRRRGQRHLDARQPPGAPSGASAASASAPRARARRRASSEGATHAAESSAAGEGAIHRRRVRPARENPYVQGKRTSPSVCTSGSSSTPKRSRTRWRPPAISASTSAVVAPPVFSMKLACLGEKRAPPTARPPQPASASSSPALRPSARASSGFLNVEPNVLM